MGITGMNLGWMHNFLCPEKPCIEDKKSSHLSFVLSICEPQKYKAGWHVVLHCLKEDMSQWTLIHHSLCVHCIKAHTHRGLFFLVGILFLNQQYSIWSSLPAWHCCLINLLTSWHSWSTIRRAKAAYWVRVDWSDSWESTEFRPLDAQVIK